MIADLVPGPTAVTPPAVRSSSVAPHQRDHDHRTGHHVPGQGGRRGRRLPRVAQQPRRERRAPAPPSRAGASVAWPRGRSPVRSGPGRRGCRLLDRRRGHAARRTRTTPARRRSRSRWALARCFGEPVRRKHGRSRFCPPRRRRADERRERRSRAQPERTTRLRRPFRSSSVDCRDGDRDHTRETVRRTNEEPGTLITAYDRW